MARIDDQEANDTNSQLRKTELFFEMKLEDCKD